MKLFFSIFFLLFSILAFGQDTTAIFESSKGKWNFPVSIIHSVDTLESTCVGGPESPTTSLIIQSQAGTVVNAIMDGWVSAVSSLGDEYMMVIISGKYCLVYSGLTKPALVKGNYITKGTKIGNLAGEELFLCLLKKDSKERININRWFDWRRDMP